MDLPVDLVDCCTSCTSVSGSAVSGRKWKMILEV